ncbi:DUF452 family protein [Arenicella sp.]|nr:DUF452 family protein [Arenicella sp.]
MVYNWLRRDNDAKNVIVFFNGWGLGQTAVRHLTFKADTDVLFVSDYTSLANELPDLDAYQHRYLVAWSLGVANYAAWQRSHTDIFDTKIAVNGTMQGIDRKLGIAEKVVQHTIDTLCVDSLKEFISRCYNHQLSEQTQKIIKAITELDVSIKKKELEQIKDRQYSSNTNLVWDTIWISQQDKIFPSKNQQIAWQGHDPKLIDTAHMAFQNWRNWQDLLVSK